MQRWCVLWLPYSTHPPFRMTLLAVLLLLLLLLLGTPVASYEEFPLCTEPRIDPGSSPQAMTVSAWMRLEAHRADAPSIVDDDAVFRLFYCLTHDQLFAARKHRTLLDAHPDNLLFAPSEYYGFGLTDSAEANAPNHDWRGNFLQVVRWSSTVLPSSRSTSGDGPSSTPLSVPSLPSTSPRRCGRVTRRSRNRFFTALAAR